MTLVPQSLVSLELGNYLGPGYAFGLGFAVLTDAESTPEPDNDGVFRWAGAANTFSWIDPASEFIGTVWTPVGPFAVHDLEREFQTPVYDAIQ